MASLTAYKISDRGIDKFEEVSAFKREPSYSGINITNIQGTTVVGDRNVVHVEHSELSQALLGLENQVRLASISDPQKLELLADIQSLKHQLVKQKPDRSVVRRLWEGIEAAGTAAGIVQGVAMVRDLILRLVAP